MTALLLLLSTLSLAGQAPQLAGTDASAIPAQLGVTLVIEASLVLDAGESAALDLPRSSTDTFSIAEAEKIADPPSAKFRVNILPLAVGKIPVPLHWTVTGPGGTRAAQSEPLWLEVAEPQGLAPEAELLEIKPPMAARPALWPWLLAAALGAAAWECWRRRRRKAAALAGAAESADTRPCELIAESELASLEGAGLWERQRYKEFYAALTEIVRRYLERRFGVPATRLTSAELQRHLRQAEVDRGVALRLRELLERADLVKFAKITPDAGWGPADLASSRGMVQETTPQPLEPAAGAPTAGAPPP